MPPSIDPDRRAALNAAKLRALVRDGFGVEQVRPVTFPRGAALEDGTTGWVLVDERPERALGPAMAWAHQRALGRVHLIVDRAAAELARRAHAFAEPPSVWQVEGRGVVRADPAPAPEPPTAPAAALALVEVLEAAGVEVIVEDGIVRGEVLGLEVAQVSVDDAGVAALEVGVGRHDREAFAIVHGDLPAPAALRAVIDSVRAQRRPGADAHPLNRLAPERWLLRQAMADPRVLGTWALERVPGTVTRTSVKDVVPAAAVGTDDSGAPVVVAASSGIDLDLVPVAADVRARFDPEARLVLVLAERDAHPVTRRMAGALHRPAEILTVPDDWRESLG